MKKPRTSPIKLRATTARLGALGVYEGLKEMILSFDLYPGTRVTETELADFFGVSRTPVREALQKLEVEGYLSVRPKQGVFIRELNIEELSEYYKLRVALELLAVESACSMMANRDLEVLEEIWNPQKVSTKDNKPDDIGQLDEEFHIAIAHGSGNQVLETYLRDINNRIRIIRRMDFTDYDRTERTYREHHAILRHLLDRNVDKAKTEMRAHIQRSEEFAKTLTLTQLARRKSFAKRFPKTRGVGD